MTTNAVKDDTTGFLVYHLPKTGRTLEPDTDNILARVEKGTLLSLHIPPGDYEYETHDNSEFLICASGSIVLEAEQGGVVSVGVGEMIEIPTGISHRFAPTTDAVVLTYIQTWL